MNRDEILKKAQSENKGRDEADLDAQRRGAYIAYMVGICLLAVVELVEWLVFGRISCGAIMAIFAMGFTAFLIKYIVARKKHELIVTICYGCLTVIFLIGWILRLTGGAA